MKQILKTLLLMIAFVTTGQAMASLADEMCPYVGLEYKQLLMKANTSWSAALPKSFPGGSLYLGSKFSENFGAELGYTWTTRKSKVSALANFFGVNTGNATTNSTVRLNSFYFDIDGYIPMDYCFELMGSIGIATTKPKVTVLINNAGTLTTANQDGFQSINGHSKGIFRVGVGAQYLLTDILGLRGIIRWEGTNRLRINGNTNFDNLKSIGVSSQPYKNAFSLALGVYIKF